MEPIRILQIVPAMNAGGMETFIMNVYRAIDRTKVQFDFLYHYDMPCFYDDEILSLGGRIFKFTVRQDNRLPQYLRQLNHFFAQHPEYRVIHGHYSGFGMFYNSIAKRHGITVRAGHSHNTNYEHNLVGQLDRLMSWFFPFGLTHRFACGMAAGNALYRGRSFTYLPNGVDAAAFAPNAAARQQVRRSLDIPDDAPVYGHIGRFTQQKNHSYLLQIFHQILLQQPNARLLLLGEGPLLEQVRQQALSMGDRVIFAGVQKDTRDFYSAMDAFLLPSLFEGLPVVLVEAQAAGLPCFVSDTVDRDAAFSQQVHFLPLNSAHTWADAVTSAHLQRDPAALFHLQQAGYDIVHTASVLQNFYLTEYAAAPERHAGQ